MRLLLVSGVVGVAFLGTPTPLSAAAYAPRVGTRHADFVLPAIDDGRPVSLSSQRGKKVLLVHFASW